MDNNTDQKYRAPALEKGLDVLELLARTREPMSTNQISDALGRSVSELFRMIQVLQFRGYVEISSNGVGYVLSNRLFALGVTRAPARDLVEAALPNMRRLADRTIQSCHLVVASGDQIVVVARIEAPGDLGFSVRIGYRISLVPSTSGLVLYAFQPEITRAEWKARLSAGLPRRVWQRFEQRGHEARERGFARQESTSVDGVIDLSAPIMQHGGVVAALTMPFVKTSRSGAIDEARDAVIQAADQISADLAGSGAAASALP